MVTNEFVLLRKDYGWESIIDIEEDICDVMNANDIPGEFKGTVRIVVSYDFNAENE